jgi:histidinol dehydrogenase
MRAYVCTGTTDYATQTVLMGRVPADVAEIVNLIVDSGNGPGAPLEIAKP